MSEGTIVERLRFDAIRCELNFSKGVATNMEEAADEIERLKADLKRATERDSGGYAPDGKTWKQAVFDEAAKRAEAERLLSEAWEKAAGIAEMHKDTRFIAPPDDWTANVGKRVAAAIRSSAPGGRGG